MREMMASTLGAEQASRPQGRFLRALWLDLNLFLALCRRELIHLRMQRSRWMGVILQPLLFWIILGSGMSEAFVLKNAGDISYLTYFYPGTLVMILMFTTIFATISVIEDRQTGFFQAVLVAPGSRAAMVLGKVGGVSALALIQAGVFLVIAPFAGFSLLKIHWPLLLMTLVLACVGLSAVNFVMAWWVNSSQAYHALMSLILIPLWVVSGAMFPLAEESWLRVLMRLNPISYSVWGVHAALNGGTSTLSPVSGTTNLLVLLAAAFFAALGAISVAKRRGRSLNY